MMTTKGMRNVAFVALMTVALVGVATKKLRAVEFPFGCFGLQLSQQSAEPRWAYVSACGWYDLDPCENGSVQSWCNWDVCVGYFSGTGGYLTSCYVTGPSPQYWLSWAECTCY